MEVADSIQVRYCWLVLLTESQYPDHLGWLNMEAVGVIVSFVIVRVSLPIFSGNLDWVKLSSFLFLQYNSWHVACAYVYIRVAAVLKCRAHRLEGKRYLSY